MRIKCRPQVFFCSLMREKGMNLDRKARQMKCLQISAYKRSKKHATCGSMQVALPRKPRCSSSKPMAINGIITLIRPRS